MQRVWGASLQTGTAAFRRARERECISGNVRARHLDEQLAAYRKMGSATARACLEDEKRRFANKDLPSVRATVCLA